MCNSGDCAVGPQRQVAQGSGARGRWHTADELRGARAVAHGGELRGARAGRSGRTDRTISNRSDRPETLEIPVQAAGPAKGARLTGRTVRDDSSQAPNVQADLP
uniref:Uncharacterized protein n=1 Tax=Paenibacillus athensensis TaxID=1967502 RepID=A0A4Y8PXP1_9BACL